MKFGKHIQSQQVPGWSAYYLDYKFLKKIISSLAAKRPASEAAALALGIRPSDILYSPQPEPPRPHDAATILQEGPGQPPLFPSSDLDDDRGPDFQAHKAAFFFKLERELEKINAFYLQKEAELKLRLETLLSKRRAAAMRVLPDAADDSLQNHVEWSAVEEGFRLLERDLGKLEQFIEINAMGFRKILKKWDKRSKSTTKEMYLARQVDVQPVFNRQLISELSDTVASCLLNLTDLSTGLTFEGSAVNNILTQQITSERSMHIGPFRDLENNFRKAVASQDKASIKDLVHYSDVLAQEAEGKANVTRILWKIVIDSPPHLADLILSSLTSSFDFLWIDDINGRSCLHEASIAGSLRLVDLCLTKGVQRNKVDVYGRSALHYGSMKGYADICRRLLDAKLSPDILDVDNYSPLIYATLRGSAHCLEVLLEEALVLDQLTASSGDLIPLSLASQSGHIDAVLLLLQHGAKSLPNSNGEYPMHLAAKEGHADVCKLLLHQTGWDTPDKYHEWTPLIHATRHGHESCLEILLAAGARVDLVDEFGRLAVHYAAWYGHHRCANRLLSSTTFTFSERTAMSPPRHISPADRDALAEMDVDSIPSLSLPPPIMPHRVYGHNYLDKNFLIQVSIGRSLPQRRPLPDPPLPAVRLQHRLISLTTEDQYLLMSAPLKLVMTSGDVNSAPYSISLPQQDECDVFCFQTASLDSLSLRFSVYPNVGTKTIGVATALPTMFREIANNQIFTLPILDNRLNIIGEVSFAVNIITPFNGVTLEVGGSVETYWKSVALSPTPVGLQPAPRSIGSTHTSPSTYSVTSPSNHSITISSLSGSYVHLVVQVTRDFHPVIFPDWLLPGIDFELGVADVTLAQFEQLAHRLGPNLNPADYHTAQDWFKASYRSMVSLSHLMKILPSNIGVALELAYPSQSIQERLSLRHQLHLNKYVDSVLRSIYHTSASPGSFLARRRRLSFTSFSPDICAALNWKQPNYPVFYSSQCGMLRESTTSPTALNIENSNDRRLSSLGAAVDFAKLNNLLGVFVDADMLEEVPSLIQGIKDAGLLVGVYRSSTKTLDAGPDAFIRDGIVVYKDHSTQESV